MERSANPKKSINFRKNVGLKRSENPSYACLPNIGQWLYARTGMTAFLYNADFQYKNLNDGTP
ncbi:hypothetical protein, partial [Conchiformibius kuhniae]|uniref:hypothetical protein n=1 Tax=Conchiformibius kuhniae TaxID=211502 RepID=UPI001B7F8570